MKSHVYFSVQNENDILNSQYLIQYFSYTLSHLIKMLLLVNNLKFKPYIDSWQLCPWKSFNYTTRTDSKYRKNDLDTLFLILYLYFNVIKQLFSNYLKFQPYIDSWQPCLENFKP